jgi:hypothetical protein
MLSSRQPPSAELSLGTHVNDKVASLSIHKRLLNEGYRSIMRIIEPGVTKIIKASYVLLEE